LQCGRLTTHDEFSNCHRRGARCRQSGRANKMKSRAWRRGRSDPIWRVIPIPSGLRLIKSSTIVKFFPREIRPIHHSGRKELSIKYDWAQGFFVKTYLTRSLHKTRSLIDLIRETEVGKRLGLSRKSFGYLSERIGALLSVTSSRPPIVETHNFNTLVACVDRSGCYQFVLSSRRTKEPFPQFKNGVMESAALTPQTSTSYLIWRCVNKAAVRIFERNEHFEMVRLPETR
ncbi:unnamed protein product, partial [Nesidiocoris tenuis]